MSTENIIHHIINDDIKSAKDETENILYSKIQNQIESLTRDITSKVYEDSIGIAGLLEKKKNLDDVGDEDEDIDNDGDVDDEDEYLNNRRNKIGFAIKKRKKDND